MRTNKSVVDIIAGALEIFTKGPKGETLKKARWNNYQLRDEDDDGNETYCALGALSKSAYGAVSGYYGRPKDNYRKAADLVASCIPGSTRYHRQGIIDGGGIPNWNDTLSKRRGFTSVKSVFCKALKKAIAEEGNTSKQR